MSKFMEALSSGKVLVRRVYINPNKSEQVTVQYIQQVKKPTNGNFNKLLAVEQGLDFDPSVTTVTNLRSFKREIAEIYFKELDHNYFEADEVYFADSIYGQEVGITCIENTEKNPNNPNQQPKSNPSTGEVLKFQGKEIYRHTFIAPIEEMKLQFLQHDTVEVNKLNKTAAAKIMQAEKETVI